MQAETGSVSLPEEEPESSGGTPRVFIVPRAGSMKAKAYDLFLARKDSPDRQKFLAAVVKLGASKSSASSWYQEFSASHRDPATVFKKARRVGEAALAARGSSYRRRQANAATPLPPGAKRAPKVMQLASIVAAAVATGAPRDYVAIADQYAREVISGAIPACKYARLACARHQADLKKSANPRHLYLFDPKAANAFCANIERYPHVKGRWAAKKQLVQLSPWQCFILVVSFGWKRRDTGKRRFREMDIFVPRKNGKSLLAAAIGNNMMLFDEEHGAEVYAGATSEKQAWEVFSPAKLMLEKSPAIVRDQGVEIWAKALVRAEDNSRFLPVIGKPGDGSSPSCAIVDEYHEHASSDLVDTMVTGMGAREQPMLVIITTAGTNLGSPCYDKYLEAKKVLEGVIENDEMFAIIYGVDEAVGEEPGDDWTDPDALRKANPNLGVSVDEDYLLAQQRQAINNPAYQNRFKTKHLDIWCAASTAGINMAHWRQCADPSLRMADFTGEQVWFSLDLASKTDICCFAKLFKRTVNGLSHYYAFVRHYLPEAAIEEATHNQQSYRKWMVMQRLIVTPGAEIDFDMIRDDVSSFAEKFLVQEIVYDPWRATQLAHQLRNDGATVVEMPQTAKHMGAAYDELLAAMKSGRFHHDGDPVLEWMASNVVTKDVVKGLTLPSKQKPEQKIDGIVAINMAISRAMNVEVSGWFSNPVMVS